MKSISKIFCYILFVAISLFCLLTRKFILPAQLDVSFADVVEYKDELPIILEWNGYSWLDISYEDAQCDNQCIFTRNKSYEANATIVTVHIGTHDLHYLPKGNNSARMNVFVNFEPPPNTPILYTKERSDYFNLTATYRFDSDFPMPYDCFELLEEDDTDKWHDHEVEEIISKKTLPVVTFVSNCPMEGNGRYTSSNREVLLKNLQRYINVTSYGQCFNKEALSCPRWSNCEEEELENHYFVMALENAHCTDYITEKVWRLRNLTVPIIMDRNLLKHDLMSLNPYVIAASDFKSVEDLAKYLEYLMENKEEYRKYFEWTKLYKKKQSCAVLDNMACLMCDMAWKVKKGYRKHSKVKKWWHENTCEEGYAANIPASMSKE